MLEVSWPALRVRSVSAFFGLELALVSELLFRAYLASSCLHIVFCFKFSTKLILVFLYTGLTTPSRPLVLRASYQQQTSTFSGLGLATKHVLSGIGVSLNIGF